MGVFAASLCGECTMPMGLKTISEVLMLLSSRTQPAAPAGPLSGTLPQGFSLENAAGLVYDSLTPSSKRAFFLAHLRIERFNFEKGETRGGGTAPPGPQRRPAQSERKNRVFSAKRQAVWFEMQSISN